MSSGLQHGDCAESLAAYALGALPDEESARVREHLAGCQECRTELASLRPAVDALPASVPQIEPPPELERRVMQVVEAEAQTRTEPAGPTPARRRWWPFALSPSVALVGACSAAVLAVGIVLALGKPAAPGPRTVHAQVVGAARADRASASLRIRGTRARLLFARLPAPGAGRVSEVWVEHGSAAPVPAGTFATRSGSVIVGRPIRRGDSVLVTVEPRPGSPAPTSAPFVVARV
ncbi:MAG TPA: anti-sigma factor [Solirubrobacteraceae bacterium]